MPKQVSAPSRELNPTALWVITRDAVTDKGRFMGDMLEGQSQLANWKYQDFPHLKEKLGCEFEVRTDVSKTLIAGLAEAVTTAPLVWAIERFGDDAFVILYKDRNSDVFTPVKWKADL